MPRKKKTRRKRKPKEPDTTCMKCYKLNKCFEQRGRGCTEYRDIEEIRKEIIDINIEYGSAGRQSAEPDQKGSGH